MIQITPSAEKSQASPPLATAYRKKTMPESKAMKLFTIMKWFKVIKWFTGRKPGQSNAAHRDIAGNPFVDEHFAFSPA